MIFQSYALWPHMTVAQNVAYGLRFKPSSRAERPACGHAAVVQLAGYEGRYPGELSGGQQQRVARGARPGGRARDPAARRAAVQPRRQPARGDALRDPPPARGVRHHHALRHPRPGRGDDHGRHDRGDEPGRDRAGRHARRTSTSARAEFVARFIGGTNVFHGRWGRLRRRGPAATAWSCAAAQATSPEGETPPCPCGTTHMSLRPPTGRTRHQRRRRARSRGRSTWARTATTWSQWRTRAKRHAVKPAGASPAGPARLLHLPPENCARGRTQILPPTPTKQEEHQR